MLLWPSLSAPGVLLGQHQHPRQHRAPSPCLGQRPHQPRACARAPRRCRPGRRCRLQRPQVKAPPYPQPCLPCRRPVLQRAQRRRLAASGAWRTRRRLKRPRPATGCMCWKRACGAEARRAASRHSKQFRPSHARHSVLLAVGLACCALPLRLRLARAVLRQQHRRPHAPQDNSGRSFFRYRFISPSSSSSKPMRGSRL
jgi:hypothetical protein